MAELQRLVVLRPVYGRSLVNHEPITFVIHGSVAEIGAARTIVEAAMRPVDRDTALRALGELAVMTKGRVDDPDREELRMAAYLGRLADYPTDAVLHACRAWADRSIWWPEWAELRPLLEQRVARRRTMLDAVRQAETAAGTAEELK